MSRCAPGWSVGLLLRGRAGEPIARRPVYLLLTVLIGGEVLIGCGGASVGSKTSGDPPHVKISTQPIHRPWPTQAAAPAIAACKRAVERVTSLPASARSEIAEPCDRMDERVKENEALAGVVCQELASATSVSPSDPGNKRVASACYAEYAKTLKSRPAGDIRGVHTANGRR